jgi:hypothetical protein
VSRRRRYVPGQDRLVRFVCIDRYHDDRPHRVAVLRLGEDGLIARGTAVTERERPEGGTKLTIRCKCGINQQRSRDELSRIAADLFDASPGATRVDLEISTLRGAVSGHGGQDRVAKSASPEAAS